MKKITTNKRFDKLTNLGISTHYRHKEYYFMKSSFLGAFAYWVVVQSPYSTPDITEALKAFDRYMSTKMNEYLPHRFTYDELANIISEDVFDSIPEIQALNVPKVTSGPEYENRHETQEFNPDFDFISLGALARNVFYMLLREQITQG